MAGGKTIIFLGDGMADEPVDELSGRTPLQHARTPAMDSIARAGCSGTLLTLPEGFPTSSEVANMSVLGCNLATEYCGRGPLEAAGRNVRLGPDDVAFRVNLITVEDGVLRDYSGGHVAQQDAEELVAALNAGLGSDKIRFHPGVSYRNLLVLIGPEFSHLVSTDKPDDNRGQRVADHLPAADEPEAEPTAALLRQLINDAPAVLDATEVGKRLAAQGKPAVNGIWPWSGGKTGGIKSLSEKFGIRGAVISAVDVIVGLGRMLGMEVVTVPGTTGYIDTNYEGKADAAVEALKTHDFVYLHVEAIDEVSHAGDLQAKLQAIEDFDSRVVGRVLAALPNTVDVAVLPDHPVPIAIGKHTRTPVPVAVRLAGRRPDSVTAFSEIDCPGGGLGHMRNGDLMALLFGG